MWVLLHPLPSLYVRLLQGCVLRMSNAMPGQQILKHSTGNGAVCSNPGGGAAATRCSQ
jgi:hypothetical protein